MKDHNQNADSLQPDELDHKLDAALAKYAAVEPRSGLEQRILTNLQAERMQIESRAWRRWGLAAAAVAVIVLAVGLAWRLDWPTHPEITSHPQITSHPSVTTPGSPKTETQAANRDGNTNQPRTHRPIRRTITHQIQSNSVVAANPKLDLFPSPQPLSEQEKILANYVAKYPEHAALVAEARTEALRRDAEERRRQAAEDRDSEQ